MDPFGLGCGGLRFKMVQGVGFRVQGLGFRGCRALAVYSFRMVQGFGFKISGSVMEKIGVSIWDPI